MTLGSWLQPDRRMFAGEGVQIASVGDSVRNRGGTLIAVTVCRDTLALNRWFRGFKFLFKAEAGV